mgnify:CR=1 FL=1
MHIDSCLEQEKTPYEVTLNQRNFHIDDKELEAIMEREFGPDKHPYYRYSHNKTPAKPVNAEYNTEIRKKYVIVDGSSGEQGIVVRQSEPKIRGVAVVCEGGGNQTVKQQIIETVTALLDISSARVSVAKMN